MSHITKELLDFLNSSPSRYHVIDNMITTLKNDGYERLTENQEWKLKVGGKYYVTRNNSSLIAFRIPVTPFNGFIMTSSHCDSPTFHVKVNAEMESDDGYIRINTEKYGGCLMTPWFDRPLTVSGRLLVETEEGIETKLVYVDKDFLIIPSVAIHMNRSVNDGYKYDPKCDTVPLFGLKPSKGYFMKTIADYAGVSEDSIIGHDLYLNIRQKAYQWGINNEFISGACFDDLQCAFGCFKGFLAGKETENAPMYVLFDSEEIGSNTKQGANGTFLESVVERICSAFSLNVSCAVANSFMISADNANIVHPNHPEYSDFTHRNKMNEGVVIKHGARYATDGASQAIFIKMCKKANVPYQVFFNRSDLSGGGTLGCISIAHVSLHTVDIGLPQLSMHSCVETAGADDVGYLAKAVAQAHSMSFFEENGIFTIN